MKNFVGGVLFGAVAIPCMSYLVSLIETATNLLVTKMSVIIAADAAKIEQDDGTVTHAIGFAASDEEYEDMEDEDE